MRARAIETQCRVVAAAQCGTHGDGRQTYGHSVAIDPWGAILADAEGEEAMAGKGYKMALAPSIRQRPSAPVRRSRWSDPAPRGTSSSDRRAARLRATAIDIREDRKSTRL